MLRLLLGIALFVGVRGASDVENIKANGYPAEAYNVTTSDGYILGLQRIPHGKTSGNSATGRKVVFLLHGLVAGSNCFTYLSPEYAMAYILADAGYDVWMGNARGNSYSRHHVSLDPDKDSKKFFDFSFQEIALIDVPAMIDFVLDKTQQEKLYYIGHAQGGTAFFILNSHTDAYHSKIASAHLLSGVGYEKHFPNKKVKVLSGATDVLYSVTSLIGFVELKPSSPITAIFVELLVNTKAPQEILKGAAFKQAVHYLQNYRDEAFRKFDHGTVTNLVKYGRITPPSYDLSKINIDVTLHYGPSDPVVSEADTLAMAEVMPKAKTRRVPRDDFSHLDYFVSKDAKTLVIDCIIEALQKS